MSQPDRRAWREGELTAIGAIIERNIELATSDPIARGGFTQVPNFILKNPQISVGAKVAYAMFLSYAWNNDFCFPGQDGLAKDMGITRPRVTQFDRRTTSGGTDNHPAPRTGENEHLQDP